MRVLDRYIVTVLVRHIALSMAVLLVLAGLFLFVNEQGWVGAGDYGQWQALRFVAAQLPATALQFLPVAALLGALLGLGQLARGSELTVMRAAGVSVARIAGAVALAGALLLPLAVAVGEWFAPPLAQMARVSRALERNDSLALAEGAAWVRDGGRLLRADGDGGLTVFDIGDPRALAAITVAGAAQPVPEGGWQLLSAAQTRFSDSGAQRGAGDTLRLQTAASAELFELARADPRQQSLATLHAAIGRLDATGQDARRQRFAYWSALARLASVPLAMLLAVPLVLGFLRTAETGTRASLGLVIGLVYFIAQRMVESGALVFDVAPALLAWLPTLLLAAAVTLLLRGMARI